MESHQQWDVILSTDGQVVILGIAARVHEADAPGGNQAFQHRLHHHQVIFRNFIPGIERLQIGADVLPCLVDIPLQLEETEIGDGGVKGEHHLAGVFAALAVAEKQMVGPLGQEALNGKFGGNMGASGCVSFMFSRKGIIVLDNEDGDIDEDKAMEDILEAGGDDFSFEDGVVEITTDPSVVSAVAEELGKKGYKVVSAEAEQVPSTYTTLTDEDHIKKMNLLLEALDDNDDVQNVWHNWDGADDDSEE